MAHANNASQSHCIRLCLSTWIFQWQLSKTSDHRAVYIVKRRKQILAIRLECTRKLSPQQLKAFDKK
jgi:hypothetical protein